MSDRNEQRGKLIWAVLLTLLVGLCGCSEQDGQINPGSRDEKKSVVLVSIDTCRADHLSCYGYPKKTTPNIDSVAKDGVMFMRAQTTNPITLPAHSSLLTGTLPPYHGVHNNYLYRLGDSQVSLAEILKENGYQTAAFVGAYPMHSTFGINQGFDIYDDDFTRRSKYAQAEKKPGM